MILLPLAGIYPGEPDLAYRAAYELAIFDHSFGKDLNAALVAGLASALDQPMPLNPGPEPWLKILAAMRNTDPYQYGKVPWVQRSVERWLELAQGAANQADRRPARLFSRLEDEFRSTIKWEAQVPFTVTFAVLALCQYDPLAALQLSIEWGHDTDSYAQLVGALVGALHGPDVFPAELRSTVIERLRQDYGEDLESWVQLLLDLQALAARKSHTPKAN
jgi:hypothetical protein